MLADLFYLSRHTLNDVIDHLKSNGVNFLMIRMFDVKFGLNKSEFLRWFKGDIIFFLRKSDFFILHTLSRFLQQTALNNLNLITVFSFQFSGSRETLQSAKYANSCLQKLCSFNVSPCIS